MESLGGLLFPLFLLLLFVPIFLSGRKQRRLAQEAQRLQGSLQVGDVVTTTSGLRGTVVDVQYEETVDLEIADDVVTTWLRAAVRDRVVDSTADAVDTPAEARVDTPADTTVGTTVDTADGTPVDADRRVVDGETPSGAHTDVTARPVDSPSDANGTPRP